MALNLSTENLARASASHPWRVIGIWLVVIVAAMVAIMSFLEAQKQGLVDPQLDSEALAITLMGTFHGLVLHKSLDSTIDIGACGDAMRAMYQNLFRITEDAA